MSGPLGDSVLGSWFENDAAGKSTWADVQRELQDSARLDAGDISAVEQGTVGNGFALHDGSLTFGQSENFNHPNLASFSAESPRDLIEAKVSPNSKFSRLMTENGFGAIVDAVNTDGVEMTTRITPEGTWARTYNVNGFNRTVAVYEDGRVVERLTKDREELLLARNDQITYVNPRLPQAQRTAIA